MRPPTLRLAFGDDEIIVDSFAGGGGASEGIRMTFGRDPHIAINHNREALAIHKANHPGSQHFQEDVWKVDPVKACAGRPVGLMWLSPDCTFFSKAKGGKPVERKRRGLAFLALRWIKAVRPRVIVLENVEEFKDWGPLGPDNKPDKVSKGLLFRFFVGKIRAKGYAVEWRLLRACDYGSPTSRLRLFLVARCDGRPIVWPEPTHGTGRLPYRTAAECINWSIPCPSIFGRKKPLVKNTMRRIARGLRRYVLESPRPFIVPLTHQGDARVHSIDNPMPTITAAHRGEHALVAPLIAPVKTCGGGGNDATPADRPMRTITTSKRGEFGLVEAFLQTYYGGEQGETRGQPLDEPLRTQSTENRFGLVAANLCKHFGGNYEGPGAQLDLPMPTVTTVDHHALVTSLLVKFRGGLADHHTTAQAVTEPIPTLTAGGMHLAEVRAFLFAFYGTGQDQSPQIPLATITTKDRFGLVTVEGRNYVIGDIGMRMLAPRELFNAQGFRPDYVIDPVVNGKRLSKTAQVAAVGNSVAPHAAAALLRANFAIAEEESAAQVA